MLINFLAPITLQELKGSDLHMLLSTQILCTLYLYGNVQHKVSMYEIFYNVVLIQ